MNIYKKFCPNVFVAQCTEEYSKGDVITIITKYGKENNHIIHNLVKQTKDFFYYSITRQDGFNNQERAKKKIEKLKGWEISAKNKAEQWLNKSNEGRDFLVLGEPIKVGHHSEKKHRALIDRNWKRMDNAIKEDKKAAAYQERAIYWESMVNKINLSMPESLEYFAFELGKAKKQHLFYKNNPEKREHSFSLTYAKKRVNDMQKKYNIAKLLWE